MFLAHGGTAPQGVELALGKRREHDTETGAWTWSVEKKKKYRHDRNFSRAVAHFLRGEKASSITDFGCGRGDYVRDLRRAGFHVAGYDGNLQTQNMTDGACSIANLAYPMDVEHTDWTMTIEVAEHVPKKHEHAMMTNIVSHALCGIILSWSNSRSGIGHVNMKSQEDVIKFMLHNYGFLYDEVATLWLKSQATNSAIAKNVQVFRRNSKVKRVRRYDAFGSYPLKNSTCVA